jgi:hypothetical protein
MIIMTTQSLQLMCRVVVSCRVVPLMMQKENADDASNASKVDCSIPQNDMILTSR